MKSEPFKTEKTPYGVFEYRRIKAWQARNYDGSLARYRRGTLEGERDVLEKRFIPKDKSQSVRYTNHCRSYALTN